MQMLLFVTMASIPLEPQLVHHLKLSKISCLCHSSGSDEFRRPPSHRSKVLFCPELQQKTIVSNSPFEFQGINVNCLLPIRSQTTFKCWVRTSTQSLSHLIMAMCIWMLLMYDDSQTQWHPDDIFQWFHRMREDGRSDQHTTREQPLVQFLLPY